MFIFNRRLQWKTLRYLKHKTFRHITSNVNVTSTATTNGVKPALQKGPSLHDFIQPNVQIQNVILPENVPYLHRLEEFGRRRKVFFDVYGCQMNVNDTEIIWSILKSANYLKTTNIEEADVILIVTCAIRDGAEKKIWHRVNQIKQLKRKKKKDGCSLKIGILGCMAERLKESIVEKEKAVDLVAGPDSYKDLPRLLALTENNQKAVNVLLSLDETYADVVPVRLNENSVTAFVSIMRGCDNMCSYCIVPFTRGRERSRPIASILTEVEQLAAQDVKEITLLGQNVNSYRDTSEENVSITQTKMAKGFRTVYKTKTGGLRFADLLDRVAALCPEVRIRFTSPHPKDFPDDVLEVIKSRANVCKSLHIPAQSGNSDVLEKMRRGYTREAYLELIEHIREILPGVCLSSDFICGFCSETEDQFEDTLSLMEIVKYNVAYLFAYSMREKTTAYRRYEDDVPYEEKINRVQRMSEVFRKNAERLNRSQIGETQLVLIEGDSKKSDRQFYGRNDGNIKVIFSKDDLDGKLKPGDYVAVRIDAANSQVLKGVAVEKTSLRDFCVN